MLISDTLRKFFIKFIEEGIYPNYLKIAEIIPVFKKANRYMATNYRSISLLSQFDKLLFEKLIYNRIYSFVQKYNLLRETQFTFRQNHYTTCAISYMYDSLLKNVDEGKYSCCIFLDLCKAFDTVNHRNLLQKLKTQFGIRGTSLELLKNFLNEQQQYLNRGGEISEFANVTCGISLGSSLGPLLFLLQYMLMIFPL